MDSEETIGLFLFGTLICIVIFVAAAVFLLPSSTRGEIGETLLAGPWESFANRARARMQLSLAPAAMQNPFGIALPNARHEKNCLATRVAFARPCGSRLAAKVL
jgi:hypothetical protein